MSKRRVVKKRKKACALCGKKASDGVGLTTHHVFHGNRFKHVSERYGMLLTLCDDCHKRLHSSRELDKQVQKACQLAFEERYSREEFTAVFGKSWLTADDDAQYRQDLYLRRAVQVMLRELDNLYLE